MQAIHYLSDQGEYKDTQGNKVVVICDEEIYPAAGLEVTIEETESLEAYLDKHKLTIIPLFDDSRRRTREI